MASTPSSSTPPRSVVLPFWFAPLFYLLLAAVFLAKSLFTGDVFLPARLLAHVAPWAGNAPADSLPQWNPLRWDALAQFYPWRHFAAQSVRQGVVPLWNPYQFCGTPFVANSQSAVFYPGNLLFYLLPVARAFALSALLHLTLCGWFFYRFLRRLRCADLAALAGGVVFAYCAWQTAWLQLPTFLATACWFPLVLQGVYALCAPATPRARLVKVGAGLGLAVGLMLLAGHLQIAFYGLLAAGLWGLALLGVSYRRLSRADTLARALLGLAALTLGLTLCAPQLAPALELSRVSHRAGRPTGAGYALYTEYALPPQGLVMLTLPGFFGSDQSADNPYWGYYVKTVAGEGQSVAIRHNQAETALYVGVAPLLLGLLGLSRALRRRALPSQPQRRVLFFGGLALLALLLALGTPLNALFYFGIPGFGQSGSPARALVLWAFAWAALAAFGLDSLLRHPPTRREVLLVVGAVLFLFAGGLSLAAQSLASLPALHPPGIPALGEVFARIGPDWIRLALIGAGGLACFWLSSTFVVPRSPQPDATPASLPSQPGPLSPRPDAPPSPLPLRFGAVWLALIVVDLFSTGFAANPTAPPETVYPETPGIAYLRQQAGHARVWPVNRRWSLTNPPPAVLPPNGAMVYGLRDVQGYDSLLTGQYKAWANRFARPNAFGGRDASPPEVGNMVFFQDVHSPLAPLLGASQIVTFAPAAPQFDPTGTPEGTPLYDAELAVYALPNALPRAALASDPPAETAAPGHASLVWRQDDPTRVTLETNAPVPTILTLRDQFYPGWRAWVDDRPVAITRAADAPIFRAVAVPPGAHRVAFRYEPASFRIGLYLACLASLLLAAAFSATRPRAHPIRK